MRKRLLAAALPIFFVVLYLALAPVPVDPVAWNSPLDEGLVDPFQSNDRLRRARGIDLGEHEGPEDATIGHDGYLYVTTFGGDVLRVHPRDNHVDVFAHLGGRPLGIEAAPDGTLLVANAYLGLQHVSIDGRVTTLLNRIDDKPLVYANDVAIALDGSVYFTESSTRFGAERYGGTYAAGLLDIVEHGAHGRVIEYDSSTRRARVLIDGLNFANGISISEDDSYLLVIETGHYRVLRFWLQGPRAGQTEILIDNLPGFPDNVNNGDHGRYWIGLIAPRHALLDRLSNQPFARKVLQRLPGRLRPQAALSSHVIAIDGDGVVLMNLHDPAARFPMMTGVLETTDSLYLTTLFGQKLPRLDKRDL
jgi:sugar lactone lactonase YvrE